VHEASASEAIAKMVSEEARSRGLADGRSYRVAKVNLVVGEANGYMRESLEFYFSASARGTPAEGAALGIRYVKPRLRCPSCGLEYERRRFSFECPSCGAQGSMTEIGSEFYVDTIEIEEASARASAELPGGA
jgi:hydrogenase nickel incorporation protein HypA/HybF